MAREAHTIIGAAGNIGATRVREIGIALEHACKDDDRAAAGCLITEMPGVFADASAALRAWLAEAAISNQAQMRARRATARKNAADREASL